MLECTYINNLHMFVYIYSKVSRRDVSFLLDFIKAGGDQGEAKNVILLLTFIVALTKGKIYFSSVSIEKSLKSFFLE